MDAWSNTEVLPEDPEIVEINTFEKKLGDIAANVREVRELITRFEACHFKYKQHLEHIKEAIKELKSPVKTEEIGNKHISKGEKVWENDNTGRSLIGQHYLTALKKWTGDISLTEITGIENKNLTKQITGWLKSKNSEKERLVRLLIARLTWDWKSYDEFLKEDEYKELEYQICRMDICHFAFPANLDSVIEAIGNMKPTRDFEWCGTYNTEIEDYITAQFHELNNYLSEKGTSEDKIKIWLTACLAKTIKEQIGLNEKIPQLTL